MIRQVVRSLVAVVALGVAPVAADPACLAQPTRPCLIDIARAALPGPKGLASLVVTALVRDGREGEARQVAAQHLTAEDAIDAIRGGLASATPTTGWRKGVGKRGS